MQKPMKRNKRMQNRLQNERLHASFDASFYDWRKHNRRVMVRLRLELLMVLLLGCGLLGYMWAEAPGLAQLVELNLLYTLCVSVLPVVLVVYAGVVGLRYVREQRQGVLWKVCIALALVSNGGLLCVGCMRHMLEDTFWCVWLGGLAAVGVLLWVNAWVSFRGPEE